jgi:DNA mismatch repair protein MSH5
MAGHMYINMDAIHSLQILGSEAHPHNSAPPTGSNGKENLSILGLFYQLCNTPQGKTRLRQALLRPSIDIHRIEERQSALFTLLHPSNSELFKNTISYLKKIGDARRFISQLEQGQTPGSSSHWTNYSVWAALRRFSVYSMKLKDCIVRLVADQQVLLLHQVGKGIASKFSFPF